MNQDQIVIACKITGEMLKEHALFDTFTRRKRWKNPALFAAIMSVFAFIYFVVAAMQGQKMFLGWLLLIIGFGLPAMYVGSYFSRLNAQTKQLTRKGLTLNFTVRLDDRDGVTIEKGDKQETYRWDTIVHAYRLQLVICLYPNEQQALLIPAEQTSWERICSVMPPEKVTDVRR